MPRFTPQLEGAHVLVTGGTKGIGRVIVEAFLTEGANVSYCARTVQGDEFTKFKDATAGARAVGTSVDISVPEQIQAWVNDAAKTFGRIDIVVANACPKFTGPSIEQWTKSFQADVVGLISLIHDATPYLEKRQGAGSIVVISSLAGFEATHPAVTGPYTTLKRAQATLAKDFARSLAPKGIRINTVLPGAIDSPSTFLPDGTEKLSDFRRVMNANPDWLEKVLSSIPMGKVGQAQDIANAVVFLGSQLSSYITGTNLVVDGAMATFL
ncbi:hypothetical protein NM208_g4942 [Fusarium decemcellulare]|uniref:Uncharacterized protein n=1 Tax=Fusarium decemcellulare TaxID=57161 RepID=A0ACC1SIU9_9HYPO|nr:hypothetical protein NM208_g4942 [Fusarium decemcellulare]